MKFDTMSHMTKALGLKHQRIHEYGARSGKFSGWITFETDYDQGQENLWSDMVRKQRVPEKGLLGEEDPWQDHMAARSQRVEHPEKLQQEKTHGEDTVNALSHQFGGSTGQNWGHKGWWSSKAAADDWTSSRQDNWSWSDWSDRMSMGTSSGESTSAEASWSKSANKRHRRREERTDEENKVLKDQKNAREYAHMTRVAASCMYCHGLDYYGTFRGFWKIPIPGEPVPGSDHLWSLTANEGLIQWRQSQKMPRPEPLVVNSDLERL